MDKKYEPNIKNAGTEKEHKDLIQSLQTTFTRSQSVDVRQLCPAPLAEVKLVSPPETHCYRRQYKIPEHAMPTFDETVDE